MCLVCHNIKTPIETFSGIMLFAELHKCEDLAQSAVTHIHFNFRKVVKEEEFLDLPKEHLCELLASERLRIDNEYQVRMKQPQSSCHKVSSFC